MASYERNINPRMSSMKAVDMLVNQILMGDRLALSKAITLIESTLPTDRKNAQQVLKACLPSSGNSIRIGITGVPGVGKSTFIDVFGIYLIELGHKVAVLTIDPTSSESKGSILADKTRMEQLSVQPCAFIRPTASGKALGGVANSTRESILLCEAAGFDIILVETVGVGQAEFMVHSMVDFFLLLALSGAGDELQGIKRGIMEMADAIVVTKADGDNVSKANEAKAMLASAIHLLQPKTNAWTPKALTSSALQNKGVKETWSVISEFIQLVKRNGSFEKNRNEQLNHWLEQHLEQEILKRFKKNPKFRDQLEKIRSEVLNGKTDVHSAVDKILGISESMNPKYP